MTESEMVYQAKEKFLKLNVGKIYLEVPIFSASCDMLIYNNGDIHAIEFKLKNWRQAINQAARHKLAVDYCWICMPQVYQNAIEYAAKKQVGVLNLDGELIADAPRNKTWEAERQRIIKSLEDVNDQR
jgi:hypothetical protein